MAGTIKRIAGPAYLAASVADIYTPPASSIYTLIKHIHIANVTGTAATFTLYVGATAGSAGGTELAKAESVPANSHVDLYFTNLRLASTDFLSGASGTASALTIVVMGEQVVV
jgi:hypothetical protein